MNDTATAAAKPAEIFFYDGTGLRFDPRGDNGIVVQIGVDGSFRESVPSKLPTAWADFSRQARYRAKLSDPVDPDAFADLFAPLAAPPPWDVQKYDAEAVPGTVAYAVPRTLVAVEKLGYVVALETDRRQVVRHPLADQIRRVPGDVTLVGGFLDAERFVVLDGFLSDHDEHTTTDRRLADLRRLLAGVPAVVFAPSAPAPGRPFSPGDAHDVVLRDPAQTYQKMRQSTFTLAGAPDPLGWLDASLLPRAAHPIFG